MPSQSRKKDKGKKRKLVDTSAKKDELDIFFGELEKKTIRQMKDWVFLYNGDVHAQAEASFNDNGDGDNKMTEKEVWKGACKAVYEIEIKQLEMMDGMVKRRKVDGNNNGDDNIISNQEKKKDDLVVDLTDEKSGDKDKDKNDDDVGDGNGKKKNVKFKDGQVEGEEKKEQIDDNTQMFKMMQQTLKSMADGMVQAVSKVVDGNNGGNDNNNPSVCLLFLYGYIVFCVFFILVQFFIILLHYIFCFSIFFLLVCYFLV